MYGVREGADRFEVKPWFPNPYYPCHNIYWLICPSHQVCVSYIYTSNAVLTLS